MQNRRWTSGASPRAGLKEEARGAIAPPPAARGPPVM